MSELMFDEIHEEKRIKVRSAEIVVHGTLEKPYYEIKYQTTDGEWHIGYSSRKLEHVFWWLENCFEIISYEQEIRNKAIDEFAEAIKNNLQLYPIDAVFETSSFADYSGCIDIFWEYIDEIAEQIKESG